MNMRLFLLIVLLFNLLLNLMIFVTVSFQIGFYVFYYWNSNLCVECNGRKYCSFRRCNTRTYTCLGLNYELAGIKVARLRKNYVYISI